MRQQCGPRKNSPGKEETRVTEKQFYFLSPDTLEIPQRNLLTIFKYRGFFLKPVPDFSFTQISDRNRSYMDCANACGYLQI